MSNVSLVRPGNFVGPVITGSTFGTAGSSFLIKILDFDILFPMRVEPTDGDGDAAQSAEGDYWPGLVARVDGLMVAGAVTLNFLTNYYSTTLNPIGTAASASTYLKIWLAGSQVITCQKALLYGMRWRWHRRGAVVRIVTNIMSVDIAPAFAAT